MSQKIENAGLDMEKADYELTSNKSSVVIGSLETGQVMKSIEVKDPTVEQLKSSPVGDEFGYAFWVKTKDPETLADIRAFHIPEHVHGPYILMRTDCRSSAELEHRRVALEVAAMKMAKAVGGTLDEPVSADMFKDGVSAVVRVPGGITQEQVGTFVASNYGGTFEQTRLDRAYYRNMPRDDFEKLKLAYPTRKVEEYSGLFY